MSDFNLDLRDKASNQFEAVKGENWFISANLSGKSSRRKICLSFMHGCKTEADNKLKTIYPNDIDIEVKEASMPRFF